MLEPLDLTPMLAIAEADQWLAAIEAWRERRAAEAIAGWGIENFVTIAMMAAAGYQLLAVTERHLHRTSGSGDTLRGPGAAAIRGLGD